MDVSKWSGWPQAVRRLRAVGQAILSEPPDSVLQLSDLRRIKCSVDVSKWSGWPQAVRRLQLWARLFSVSLLTPCSSCLILGGTLDLSAVADLK